MASVKDRLRESLYVCARVEDEPAPPSPSELDEASPSSEDEGSFADDDARPIVRNGLSGLGGRGCVNPGSCGRTRWVLASASSTRSPRLVLGSAIVGYFGSGLFVMISEFTHPSSLGTLARLAARCLYPGPADGV